MIGTTNAMGGGNLLDQRVANLEEQTGGNVLYQDIGNISASSNPDAVGKAWDAITVYDHTVIGHFSYNGKWLFIAHKYSSQLYGMMIAMFVDGAPYALSVMNGVKSVRSISRS